jgi:hypothetical protein
MKGLSLGALGALLLCAASGAQAQDNTIGNPQLRDFQLRRLNQAGEELGLIDTNLSLSLDRPLVLGLTTDESSSRALLVVITCTRAAQAAAP